MPPHITTAKRISCVKPVFGGCSISQPDHNYYEACSRLLISGLLSPMKTGGDEFRMNRRLIIHQTAVQSGLQWRKESRLHREPDELKYPCRDRQMSRISKFQGIYSGCCTVAAPML